MSKKTVLKTNIDFNNVNSFNFIVERVNTLPNTDNIPIGRILCLTTIDVDNMPGLYITMMDTLLNKIIWVGISSSSKSSGGLQKSVILNGSPGGEHNNKTEFIIKFDDNDTPSFDYLTTSWPMVQVFEIIDSVPNRAELVIVDIQYISNTTIKIIFSTGISTKYKVLISIFTSYSQISPENVNPTIQ